MAQKKKNIKQQKQKQKQHQKQQVIVNVITSKKRRSTKKTKGSSSSSSITSTPIIQSIPIQYTPYTMYDTTRLLTEANMRSLVPTKPPVPIVQEAPVQEAINNNMNVEDLRDARERYYRLGGGDFLENPNNQSPSVNDILENVEPIMQPIIQPIIQPVIEPEPTPAIVEESNENVPKKVKCYLCGGYYTENKILKYGYHKGEYDIIRHNKTELHINALNASKKKR